MIMTIHFNKVDIITIIQRFVDEVNQRAEKKMLEPPYKLEGMHYASMIEILAEMKEGGCTELLVEEITGESK